MVDLESGLDKLPPRERLKALHQREAERQKLEQEVAKRRKELEKLEEETEKERDVEEELEKETKDEITRESAEAELEERIAGFKHGKEFVPEGGAAPGFGETMPEQAIQYQSEALQRAREDIDYLLHGTPNQAKRQEVERDLYQSMRSVASSFKPEESYSFNKLQEEMHELKNRDGIQNSYLARTNTLLNEMTDIMDYKQQDEARRSQGG